MGDPTEEHAYADTRREMSVEHLEDVSRIAESVRSVAGADGALVSRVLDEDWLEIVAVVGTVPAVDPDALRGMRWHREHLDHSLDEAERLGHVHLTPGRGLLYVALTAGDPAGVPGSPDAHDVLLAPLRTQAGELLGVLTTVGRIDVDRLEAGASELVEVYADQARLTLTLLRENSTLAEQLRISRAAQGVLSLAAQQPDVTALLRAVAPGVADMLRGRGVWVCTDLGSPDSDAASYPAEVVDLLGPDIRSLVEPLVEVCWRQDSTLTHEERPLLGRLAELARSEQALLGSIGSGTTVRGAVLVLRDRVDPPWTDDERDALASLGRRLGVLVQQLHERRQEQDLLNELRQLDQYRRDLVASITHDLRSPLTAITLNTELLGSDAALADAGAHPVAAIRRSAERLSRLVDDLLALARAEEQIRPATEVDVVELVREACKDCEVEAQARGVRLTVDTSDEIRALVDAQALTRVYGNVVGNAVKYSLADSEVTIRVRHSGDFVEMVCEDHGVGIPEERQATVFDLVRPDRERVAGSRGAGIGLAISQRIVSRLGGGIDLASAPGRGSTFTVRVPVSPPIP